MKNLILNKFVSGKTLEKYINGHGRKVEKRELLWAFGDHKFKKAGIGYFRNGNECYTTELSKETHEYLKSYAEIKEFPKILEDYEYEKKQAEKDFNEFVQVMQKPKIARALYDYDCYDLDNVADWLDDLDPFKIHEMAKSVYSEIKKEYIKHLKKTRQLTLV